MQLQSTLSLLASLAAVTAQFTNPSKSSALQAGKLIEIKWETAGLQAPVSINLVAGGVRGRAVVAQQVAVAIQNIGILTWTPDLTIAALPSFAMVIVDAAGRVVVSDEFAIASLVQQPGFQTRRVKVPIQIVSTDSQGGVVTVTTMSTSQALLPLPTEPIKVHVSGTQVLDTLLTGVTGPNAFPTAIENGGLKPLPGFAGGTEADQRQLQPLPNVPADVTSTAVSSVVDSAPTEVPKDKAMTGEQPKKNGSAKDEGDKVKGKQAKSEQNKAQTTKVNQPMVRRAFGLDSAQNMPRQAEPSGNESLQSQATSVLGQDFNDADPEVNDPTENIALSRPPGADTTITTSIVPIPVASASRSPGTSPVNGNANGDQGEDASSQDMKGSAMRYEPGLYTAVLAVAAGVFLF